MSVDKVSEDKVSEDEMRVGRWAVDEMLVDEMLVDKKEVPVNEIPVDKIPKWNACRQMGSRWNDNEKCLQNEMTLVKTSVDKMSFFRLVFWRHDTQHKNNHQKKNSA